MKQSLQTNNDYATMLISLLYKLGVRTFCLGSGSRSAPLAYALQNHAAANTIVHYDERSLGFFALGVAKQTDTPVCVITTTASAAANLHPAVMEAFMGNTPLIVITCDRPFEDNDRGMNQTCNQQNIFGEFVAKNVSLPAAPHSFDIKAITSAISYLYAKTKDHSLPVHINIPFREPLLAIDEEGKKDFPPQTKYLPTHSIPSPLSVEFISDTLASNEKGLIVVGGLSSSKDLEEIVSLSEKTSFPILADPLSGLREFGSSPTLISHYNQVIHHAGHLDSLKPEVILFLGEQIVSKRVLVWAKSLKKTRQILISSKKRRIDPTLEIDTCIEMNPTTFAKSLHPTIPQKSPSSYLSLWKSYSLTAMQSVEDFFTDQDQIYEPQCITSLLALEKGPSFSLFIGNSLPIRYADSLYFPKKIRRKMYGNRGVSGIDGNLSTALGICEAEGGPVVAIVGDCTFLHDACALHLMKARNIPLILVVINNNGGGIFHFLPYSKEQNLVDTFVSPPTSLDIGAIVTSFGIAYWKAEAAADYTKMLDHFLEEGSHGVIEIPSSNEENLAIHQKLEQHLKKQMDKTTKKERGSYFTLPKRKSLKNPKSFVSTVF